MREKGAEASGSGSAPALSKDTVLERLAEWDITGIGLHPGGSNYVFVVRLEAPDRSPEGDGAATAGEMLAIYKPASGERPLRDFPYGTLHNRERAAYLLSEALGWPSIPPTVIRDGPHGEGSVQMFVDADPSANYFTMRATNLEDFASVAMFDVLVHNADRKGGSCLRSADGKLWAIDHGLTFNSLARRRTVMFEFNGLDYPSDLQASLSGALPDLQNCRGVGGQLRELLDPREIVSLAERAERMLDAGSYPVLDPDRNVPWPFI